MNKFDDLLGTQIHQNLNKSLGISSQISAMLKTQEQFSRSFGSLIKIAKLSKGINYQSMHATPMMSAIEAMTKSIGLHQSKFTIPHSAIEAIVSINKQHTQLFGNLKSITDGLAKYQATFSKINNLQLAFSGISGQITAIAAAQRKWDLIDDFKEIAEESIALNEHIFDGNGITKDGLNELMGFLQRIEIKVDKIDKEANSLFWKLITLLGIILTVLNETRNWMPKPEYATKQEVETVIKEQLALYEIKLKQERQFRITNRVCEVMLKPRAKSIVVERLPKDFEIVVLQAHHKWIYASYFSLKDGLPQTGWIMKKYLDKPE